MTHLIRNSVARLFQDQTEQMLKEKTKLLQAYPSANPETQREIEKLVEHLSETITFTIKKMEEVSGKPTRLLVRVK